MNFALQCPLCLLLILLTSAFASAQSNGNMSIGSFLKAANDNHSWNSPKGDFAFGFQQIGNDGFLLAIWFNKLPEKTIIWSANRNNLVQRGSMVQLTKEGEFILNDQAGERIWAAGSVSNELSYAAMLDTGNFVLADKDGVNLWESFHHSTDTILPTQTLNQDDTLIARYQESNYSNGRFMFIMQKDGNLVMYTTNYPLTTNNFAYWSTQDSIGSGYQVIFNQSGYILLVARNGTILDFVTNNAASTQDFYQRATLDYDGVLRQYVYPKTTSSRSTWKLGWNTLAFIPSDICSRIDGETGSGACGFNSYCKLGDDQRPSCLCPPGYDFVDPNDKQKGCTQKFEAQRCDDPFQDSSDHFELYDMTETNWPGSNYDHLSSQTEDSCRQACLSDCYCAVAFFNDGDCWKKRLPLSNGRVGSDVGGKALIKVRKENPRASISKEKDHSTLSIIGSVLLGCSIFVNLVLLVATRFNRRKQKGFEPLRPSFQATNIQNFSYNELENATEGFKEEVGRGSFGTVYKGTLPNDCRVVAVKKLDRTEHNGADEFRTELSVIGKTNHRNLVQLLGFCNEGLHQLLVYEYMSNGSLAQFLFGGKRPQWYRRIQIVLAIARGLFYLHEECSSQIIHCDIKPQNILLDEFLTAKISDFGLSKLLKIDQTKTTTNIRGTKGYVAPEWFRNLPITVKVDVYSFGILLLELISCRKNVELDMKDEQQIILANWACDCYEEGKFHLLVEQDEEAIDDMTRVEKFVKIAIWCIQEDPSLRPGMKKVVQMLEGSVNVAAPPHPSSFISIV